MRGGTGSFSRNAKRSRPDKGASVAIEKLSPVHSRGGNRRGPLPARSPSSLWYGLAFLLLLGLIQVRYPTPTGKPIPYSEFKTLLKDGGVTEVTIGDQQIRGTLKLESKPFTTTRVRFRSSPRNSRRGASSTTAN